jgi:hypothetical protein
VASWASQGQPLGQPTSLGALLPIYPLLMGARVCGEEVASPPKGAETSLAPPKTLPCLLCKVSPHLFIHTIHLDLNHKSVASLSTYIERPKLLSRGLVHRSPRGYHLRLHGYRQRHHASDSLVNTKGYPRALVIRLATSIAHTRVFTEPSAIFSVILHDLILVIASS